MDGLEEASVSQEEALLSCDPAMTARQNSDSSQEGNWRLKNCKGALMLLSCSLRSHTDTYFTGPFSVGTLFIFYFFY